MRVLRGIVRKMERSGEKVVDENGVVWEKCVFHIEITGFSKRVKERLPEHLRGKVVRVVRWCAFDWHYKLNVPATLTPRETESILEEVNG